MKATLLFSLLTFSLLLRVAPSSAQNYNAGYGSGTGAGGNYNVHVGPYAGRLSTGSYNSFLGAFAGYSNTTGTDNSFMGYAAGYNNSTGSYNSFLGYFAGYSNTSGNSNSFMGHAAGYNNSTGSYNSFLGYFAGAFNTKGNSNSFLGYYAGYYNSTGYNNTFTGHMAGYSNNASNNTFIGKSAGEKNTTGGINTFVGSEAGFNNTNGYNNVFMGRNAGQNNTSGRENTFLGRSAGFNNTTGYGNSALGYLAGPSTGTLTNATAIGNRARVTASNSLVLGSINGVNGATVDTKVGIRTTAPAYNLHVNGTAAKPGGGSWTAASDKRLKENIKDFKEGLATLEKIRPVSFRYNGKAGMPTEKDFIGVIAQEMQKIAPYMVGEFTYQDSTGKQEQYLDYDATALTYILVNAVKEQQQLLKQKDQEVAQLKQELAAIKELLIKHLPQAANPQARLWQNNPNPYSQTTIIQYELPASVSSASIKIFSATGQELKSFDLTGKTQGEVTLSTGMFAAGTYVYTLFIDGVSIDSKKLVLTR